MFRFVMKRRGAISIFLVIILVPMLVMSSVVVDVSRVNLGEAMAVSAGDLAANTVLTNYDYQLKEMYGLMASANDSKDFLNKIEKYYCDTIMANGIEEAVAKTLAAKARGVVESADLQNISVQENSFKVDVLEDQSGSLVNPAVTKTQIVNFMKYRAPIRMGTSIFEAVNLFKNMGKKTDVIDKKNKYYEEQANIIDLCQKARNAIGKYEDKTEILSRDFPSDAFFGSMQVQMNVHKQTTITQTGDYAKTVYLAQYAASKSGIDMKYNNEKGRWIWSKYLGKKVLTKTGVTREELQDELDKFDDDKDGRSGNKRAVSQYRKYSKNDGGGILDETSLLLQMLEEYEKEGDKSYFGHCLNLYILASSLIDSEDEEAKNLAKSVLENENYNDFKILTGVFKNYTTCRTGVTNTGSRVTEKLNDVNKYANQYINELDKKIGYLEGDGGVIKTLEKIKKSLGDLDEKRDEWNTAASNTALKNDSMAQADKLEIQQQKDVFKVSEINELIQRSKEAVTSLKKVKSAVERYNVGGVQFKDVSIDKVENFWSNYYHGDEDKLNYPNRADQNNFYTVASQQVSGAGASEFSTNGEPDLAKGNKKFYKYLKENYKEQKDGEESEAKTKKKKVDKGTEDYEKEAGSGSYTVDDKKKEKSSGAKTTGKASELIGEGAPSKIWKSDKDEDNKLDNGSKMDTDSKKVLGGSKTLMESMFGGGADSLKGARDNFYISDYVLGMFSYNTIENEYKHDGKEGTPKSITNVDINAENNALYGQEVEYIIYGGNNPVAKAYASIFGIRFASNVVYAFSDSSIRATATATATAIFGTPPLTALIPLAKIAIIVGIALIESGIDMINLSHGEKVPLYKSKETWTVSPGGIGKTVIKESVNVTVNAGMDLFNNWLESTSAKLESTINEESVAFESAVDQLIKETAEEHVQDAIDQMWNACNSAITKGVEDKEKYVREELQKWSNNVDLGSNVANAAKQEAITQILNSKKNYIRQALDSFGKKGQEASSSVVEALQKEIVDEVSKAVEGASGALKTAKDKMISDIKGGANKGAENVKAAITKNLGGAYGGGSSTGKSTTKSESVMGALLSWQYSDYLRMFLVISSIGNENKMLLRTEDVIQANMRKKDEDFVLKKSYVYYEMNATVLVEPLLTTVPLIQTYTKDKLTGKNWYTVQYSTKFGY